MRIGAIHKHSLHQEPKMVSNTMLFRQVVQTYSPSPKWVPDDSPQPQEIHVLLNLLVHLKVWQVIIALINLVLWHISFLNKGDQKHQGNPGGKPSSVRLKQKSLTLVGKERQRKTQKTPASLQQENLTGGHMITKLTCSMHRCIKTLILKRTWGLTQPRSLKELPKLRVEFDWGPPPDSSYKEYNQKTLTWWETCIYEWLDVICQLYSFPCCVWFRQVC